MKAGKRLCLMLFTVCLTYQSFCQEASVSVKITLPEFGVFTAPGSRKPYKDGNVLTTPIPVIIATSSIARKDTEIGNLDQPGSAVLSGIMTDTVPADIVDGVYTNAFTFSLYLYSTSAGSGTLTAPSKGSLTFSGNPTITQGSVSLSLNPTSVMTPLADLGEKAAVNITATRGYNLTVSSSHSGHLWLSDKDTIPYIMKVEGVIIDLSSEKEVLISDSASAGVASYTLKLAILSI